ncbi:hypothetical protein D3C77_432560 [compost metagenome]
MARMTRAFIETRTLPTGKSRYLVMIEPTISNPPDEPPARKDIPLPIPTSTPPTTADRNISVASGTSRTGIKAMNHVTDATERMLSIMKRLPSRNSPAMRIGMLYTRYITLKLRGVK